MQKYIQNPPKDIPSRDNLLEKIHKTINIAWNVGNKINLNRIKKWLDNFTGDALLGTCNNKTESRELEQKLALFLLCNFVYFNEGEVKHLSKLILEKFIHANFCSEKTEQVSNEDINQLISKTEFKILGNISESSSYLMYIFRQVNKLSKDLFKENKNSDNILIIEDFSISATQALEYICNIRRDISVGEKKIYLSLMVCTEEALNELSKIKNVTILPCIVLNKYSRAFSLESTIFEGYSDTHRTNALKMCEYYGTVIMSNASKSLGFNGGGYLIGAYYNTPDNTLPIFWASTKNWTPLFTRYDKVYSNEDFAWEAYYV